MNSASLAVNYSGYGHCGSFEIGLSMTEVGRKKSYKGKWNFVYGFEILVFESVADGFGVGWVVCG